MSWRLIVPVFLASFASAQTQRPPVQVTLPVDGAIVPYRPCVAGIVVDETSPVFSIVHPLDVDTYWVQAPITPGSGGKFLAKIYVAEPGRRRFENQTFEIRFAYRPKQKLWNGQLLGYWPEAEALSPLIRVTRRDTAPDGCDQVADESRTPVADRPRSLESQPQPARPRVDETRPQLVQPFRRGTFPQEVWPYGAMLVFFWLLFAICQERAKELIKLLLRSGASLWQVLRRASRESLTKVAVLHEKLSADCKDACATMWGAKGFQGGFARYWLIVLLCAVLVMTSMLATGTEAYILHTRLPLILPPAMDVQSFLFAAISETPLPHSNPAAARERGDTSRSNPAGSLPGSAIFRLSRAIWHYLLQQGLWFIAIGLVALQAAAGVILLLEFRGVEPLEISPWRLFRKRPVPFFCFVVLDIGLALLAGLGGAEFSPGSIGSAIPASIAAALAFVLPWLATYMIHYVIETASDSLGQLTVVLLAGAGLLLAILLQSAWTILLFILMVALSALFVCSYFGGGVLVIFLGSSVLFGEAVRRTYANISGEPGTSRNRRQSAALRPAAAATALGLVSVAIYFLVANIVSK